MSKKPDKGKGSKSVSLSSEKQMPSIIRATSTIPVRSSDADIMASVNAMREDTKRIEFLRPKPAEHKFYRFSGTDEKANQEDILSGLFETREIPCTNIVIFHNAETVDQMLALEVIADQTIEAIYQKQCSPEEAKNREKFKLDITDFDESNDIKAKEFEDKFVEIRSGLICRSFYLHKKNPHLRLTEPDYRIYFVPVHIGDIEGKDFAPNEEDTSFWENIEHLAARCWPNRTAVVCCLYVNRIYRGASGQGERKSVIPEPVLATITRRVLENDSNLEHPDPNNKLGLVTTDFGTPADIGISVCSAPCSVTARPDGKPPLRRSRHFGVQPFHAEETEEIYESNVDGLFPEEPDVRISVMNALFNFLNSLGMKKESVLIQQRVYPSELCLPCLMNSALEDKGHAFSLMRWSSLSTLFGNTEKAVVLFMHSARKSLLEQIETLEAEWKGSIDLHKVKEEQHKLALKAQARHMATHQQYAPTLPLDPNVGEQRVVNMRQLLSTQTWESLLKVTPSQVFSMPASVKPTWETRSVESPSSIVPEDPDEVSTVTNLDDPVD